MNLPRKIISLLLALSILTVAGVFSCAFAAENSNSNQQKITVTAEKIKKDGTYIAIQNALEIARKNATDSKRYVVEVEPGEYSITKTLMIFSNTHLVLTDVTLNRSQASTSNMLRIGNFDTEKSGASGYDAYKNIIIQGGTFDGGGTQNTILKAAHATNFTIQSTNFRNVNNSHIMEIAGIDGFAVKNCSFKNQHMDSEKIGYEAIQLDILKKGHIYDCRSEALPMNNVRIENCLFDDCPRGIGTHTAIYNAPFNGILIKSNRFTNLGSAAIQGMNWKNVKIVGNSIENTPRGITLYSMMGGGDGTFLAGVLADEGKTETNISESYQEPCNGNILIAENSINHCGAVEDVYANYECEGISLVGARLDKVYDENSDGSGGLPKGEYFLEGVTVRNNFISVKGHGIRAKNVRNASFTDNVINCGENDFNKSIYQGIKVYDNSKINFIDGNSIYGSDNFGIDVEDAKVTVIRNNSIDQSGDCGICLWDNSYSADISDNYIKSSGKNAMSIQSTSQADYIGNNFFYDNKINRIDVWKNSKAKLGSNTVENLDLTEFSLSYGFTDLAVGEAFGLNTTLTPSKAKAKFNWVSSNSNVARVDRLGNVFGLSPGKTTITATALNGLKASCTVTVYPAPKNIAVGEKMLILGKGEKFNLGTVLSENSSVHKVNYTTSNPNAVGFVSDNGVIQAKHIGTATVVASLFNGLHDNCNIIVKEAPASLKLNRSKLNMGLGEEFVLEAIIPDNSASSISMYSDNPRVVDVDENGRLKAKGLGTAVITAQTFNGLTAKCTVTVKEAPDNIELNSTNIKIKTGQTIKLVAKLTEGTASNELVFKSSDTSVCKIDKATGVITAKSPGTSRVSVTTYNGQSSSIEVNVVN
ncbi:MAG: Ig-like domain-containing protein [Ruminococcus sp.]|nr:Ig-like domain-containing protein [Ruminococcus sp.]